MNAAEIVLDKDFYKPGWRSKSKPGDLCCVNNLQEIYELIRFWEHEAQKLQKHEKHYELKEDVYFYNEMYWVDRYNHLVNAAERGVKHFLDLC